MIAKCSRTSSSQATSSSMIWWIISSSLSMSTSKEIVTIQLWQKRHRYAIRGAYQAYGRTPSVRGGGGHWPTLFGARWATRSGGNSGEVERFRGGDSRTRYTPWKCTCVYGGSGGVGDAGGEA
jgi:hypothetical protein